MSIQVGPITLRNRVLLAPMAGVTDAPFRACAWRNGAGMVITEMVAGEQLFRGRRDVRRRMANDGIHPFVTQLAGREARWMRAGAEMAAEMGADIIDINMGCPSRMVAGKRSGAALMRDPGAAAALIRAVVEGAGGLPVTLKMRLGWDSGNMNAPDIARRAQDAGVAMVTVHARTRDQFYKGRADWAAARAVSEALSIPMIINGDIADEASARRAMALSGAAGVMVGRGCQGRPWFAGELARALDPAAGVAPLGLEAQLRETRRLFEDMLAFHAAPAGLRNARKHLGWAVARWRRAGLLDEEQAAAWRARLVRPDDAGEVRESLLRLEEALLNERAA